MSKNYLYSAATCALFLASIASSAAPVATLPKASPGNDVVAQSDAGPLTSADVRALISALPEAERTKLTSNMPGLEQIVRSELLRRSALAAAKSEGFDRQPDTVAQLDALRDTLMVRLWLVSKSVVPTEYPSEAQVQAAYESGKASLTAPNQYRVAQIFIGAPDGADPAKLTAALKKSGEVSAKLSPSNFSKLAQDYSEHAESASKGGELGFLPENRMLRPIALAVRDMKIGEVAGPVKTNEGLHFLKLEEIKPGAVPGLAEVRDQLISALRSRRASELEQTYIKELADKSGISINEIALGRFKSDQQ